MQTAIIEIQKFVRTEFIAEGDPKWVRCPFSKPSIEDLREALLLSPVKRNVPTRVQALFEVRKYFAKTRDAEAFAAIIGAFQANKIFRDEEDSDKGDVLWRHEACYVLGQMLAESDPSVRGDVRKFLYEVALSTDESIITRHEAVEALGVLGVMDDAEARTSISDIALRVKPKLLCPLRETIELALLQEQNVEGEPGSSKYRCVDPSAPFPKGEYDERQLMDLLKDKTQTLSVRYRALFSLRDEFPTGAAIGAMMDTFAPNDSPLLQHEVAFVLGQLADEMTPNYDKRLFMSDISKILGDCVYGGHVHPMVGHEAAVALGHLLISIHSEPQNESNRCLLSDALANCKGLLDKHGDDMPFVVRHSLYYAITNFSWQLDDSYWVE